MHDFENEPGFELSHTSPRRLSSWLFFQAVDGRSCAESELVTDIVNTYRYEYVLLRVSVAPIIFLFIAYCILNASAPSHAICYPYTDIATANLFMLITLILQTLAPLSSSASLSWWISHFMSFSRPLASLGERSRASHVGHRLITDAEAAALTNTDSLCMMIPPTYNKLTVCLIVLAMISTYVVLLCLNTISPRISKECHHHAVGVVTYMLLADIVLLFIFAYYQVKYSMLWTRKAELLYHR